ncbi:hypothetical protein [Bacillus sp. FJAT-47783]|uniref:hypothetical protein n=1 Tax=Bacillus sp. FJAT-47783 TaxID=2922712 RepID=UPI001FAD9E1F|nr:hypothetical protein [Bacillus sp. FJAT-47783]
MLVNRKRKWKPKFIALSLAAGLVATAGAAGAVSKSASLDGSSTYKNTGTITATSGSTGNIYATNTGANTQTRGYGKRSIDWWPDSIVASTNWLNPGKSERRYFTQTKGHVYYGQIGGQTIGSRGSVTITVK